jgi:hypothetical protein
MSQDLESQKCDDCECIISKSKEIGAHIQLIGGWAIFYKTSQNSHRNTYDFLQRKYADIDVVGRGKEKKKIYETLKGCGYQPDDMFNGLYGDTRMLFWKGDQQLDVFLDRFEMCHTLDLSLSLNYIDDTIGLGELLFTKLQIYEINEKDLKDLVRLLLYTDIDEKGQRGYSARDFLVNTCSEDWGPYKTITTNLDKVKGISEQMPLSNDDMAFLRSRVETLVDDIERSDKSFKWKMRAKIGEKVKWYELPEEKKR